MNCKTLNECNFFIYRYYINSKFNDETYNVKIYITYIFNIY